jgi:hypothetical protein
MADANASPKATATRTPVPYTAVDTFDIDVVACAAKVTFQSSNPSVGSYNSSTGLWFIGTVGAATTVTLQITVLVNTAPPGAFTAAIAQSDQFDPNTVNNSSTVSI